MKITILLSFLAISGLAAKDRKVPPAVQALPLPYDQVSFQVNGQEWIRYHFGQQLRRPFIYPIIGPSGRSLTRMGHPHDPETHSHHNSVWISHNDVGGLSFWDDRAKGKIVQQRVIEFQDGESGSTLFTENHWINETNKQVLLQEKRSVTFRPLNNGESFVEIALELEPRNAEISLGKTPFGFVGVRMAKTIGVHDGGGTILNSEGAVDEKEVFWKHAKWVDYSGPITPRNDEGITLMDHPSNPRHPNAFHVRNDGWMGVSLTLEEALKITKGAPLRLRYGLYAHAGRGKLKELEERWRKFAESSPMPWPSKK